MLHERSELCINLHVVVARVVEVTFSKEGGFWAIELVVWSPHVLWRTTTMPLPFGECW
jgi:hypothetical protein